MYSLLGVCDFNNADVSLSGERRGKMRPAEGALGVSVRASERERVFSSLFLGTGASSQRFAIPF